MALDEKQLQILRANLQAEKNKGNIIELKDYSYHATNYSLENDLLINGAIQKNPQGYKHNQVLVTPKGEQYIKEIVTEFIERLPSDILKLKAAVENFEYYSI